ncbi:MAG: hypothetical protein AAF633_20590, partial [Chloroflexota bacterium]
FSDSVWALSRSGLRRSLGEFGSDWRPFPLAGYLLHEHVLMYPPRQLDQHQRADFDFALMVSHHLSHGYTLGADVMPLLRSNSNWISALGAIQQVVGEQLAGKGLNAFQWLEPSVAMAEWGAEEGVSIVINYGDGGPYQFDDHQIAPGGFWAESADKKRLAGIFEGRFNAGQLSDGMHVIVVEQVAEDQIDLYHPIGRETLIQVDRPESWANGGEIVQKMVLDDGREIAIKPANYASDAITVDFQAVFEGSEIKKMLLVYGQEIPLFASGSPAEGVPLTPIIVGAQPAPHIDITATQQIANVGFDVSAPTLVDAERPLEGGTTISATAPISTTQEPFQFDDNISGYDWSSSTGVVELLPQNRVALLENFETGSYARMESLPFEIEMRSDLVVDIWVTDITPGGTYTLQLQEDDGDYQTFDLIQSTRAERLSINLQGLTGWRGTKRFRFVAWVSGEEAALELGRMAISAEGALEEIAVIQSQINPVVWEERFGPLDHIWQPTDLVTTLLPDGGMSLVSSGTGQGFGKLESEIIEIDLSIYPILEVDLREVGENSEFVLQLLEEGDLYRSYDLMQGSEPGIYSFDLPQETRWEGEKAFRLLFWVVGENSRISVNFVRFQAGASETP